MSKLEEMKTFLQQGRANNVKQLAAEALEEGIPAAEILEQGLLAGMNIVGEKFKNGEAYIPEVLIAARAMNAGMEVLKPALAGDATQVKGKAVIGTVKGDLHDVGKSVVKMMFEGKGIEVVARDCGERAHYRLFRAADDHHGRYEGRCRLCGEKRRARPGEDHDRRRARYGQLLPVHRRGRVHERRRFRR